MKKNNIVKLSIAYVVVIVFISTIVHSWHYYDLTGDRGGEYSGVLSSHKGDKHVLVHVLGKGCGCSVFTGNYLLKRGAQKNIEEQVYFLNEPKGKLSDEENSILNKLKLSGFQVEIVSYDDLKLDKDGMINGVPFFEVYNKFGKMMHSGGYSNRMISRTSRFSDLDTVKKLIEEEIVIENPVYGCATSNDIKSKIDPFKLKY